MGALTSATSKAEVGGCHKTKQQTKLQQTGLTGPTYEHECWLKTSPDLLEDLIRVWAFKDKLYTRLGEDVVNLIIQYGCTSERTNDAQLKIVMAGDSRVKSDFVQMFTMGGVLCLYAIRDVLCCDGPYAPSPTQATVT